MNESMRSVTIARQIDRPSTKQFIEEIFDDFMEFHGDRLFGDDGAVIGGIASLKGQPVTVIGIQKGHTLEENVNCNFGQPNPEGYRKALRLMKQAEKFKRPVITFINTAGAFPGVGAEERGQGEAIARNLMEMSRLKTPIISIFIGEGGSGGALALARGRSGVDVRACCIFHLIAGGIFQYFVEGSDQSRGGCRENENDSERPVRESCCGQNVCGAGGWP